MACEENSTYFSAYHDLINSTGPLLLVSVKTNPSWLSYSMTTEIMQLPYTNHPYLQVHTHIKHLSTTSRSSHCTCDPDPKTTVINSCPTWVYLVFNCNGIYLILGPLSEMLKFMILTICNTNEQENLLSRSSFNDCPWASNVREPILLLNRIGIELMCSWNMQIISCQFGPQNDDGWSIRLSRQEVEPFGSIEFQPRGTEEPVEFEA